MQDILEKAVVVWDFNPGSTILLSAEGSVLQIIIMMALSRFWVTAMNKIDQVSALWTLCYELCDPGRCKQVLALGLVLCKSGSKLLILLKEKKNIYIIFSCYLYVINIPYKNYLKTFNSVY